MANNGQSESTSLPKLLLENSDAAREVGLTPVYLSQLADKGFLKITARTRRGVRLYSPEDVALFKRQREAQAKAKVK